MITLVTGGTGFAGSHLVKRLLEKGHTVRVLDNKPGLVLDELKKLGAEVHIGSVTDAQLVDKLVAGCDVVFHLAAAFREMNVARNYYLEVNRQGTHNVAESSLRHKVSKLVYCSTCGVHGNIDSPPGDENSRIQPEDYYQLTKYHGEEVVQEYVAKGLNVVILRPAAIYGPGDPERFGILFRLVKKGRFWMFGSGKTFYHPLYVDNLTDAFELAAEKPVPSGSTYLIADSEYWSLNDLVQHVAQAMGLTVKVTHLPYSPIWCAAWLCEKVCQPLKIKPPLFPRRVNWFRQDRAFSIQKAHRELGYNPRVGIAEGLRRTAEWYRQQQII